MIHAKGPHFVIFRRNSKSEEPANFRNIAKAAERFFGLRAVKVDLRLPQSAMLKSHPTTQQHERF